MQIQVLAIGDIMGKLGRKTVVAFLPNLKTELGVDLVIANGENLAHGKGFTQETVGEVFKAGVDVITSGNHMASKPEGLQILSERALPVLRPYNWARYQELAPGRGWLVQEVSGHKIAVVNLVGQAFFKASYENPFHAFDDIWAELKAEQVSAVIVDFHAEATSEKVAFGWHVDGRASLVVGTHTHIATADTRLLLQGTGYVTDLGMTGDRDGIIGVERESALPTFLTNLAGDYTLREKGVGILNSVLAQIDLDTGRCVKIERVDKEIEIT